MKAVVIKTTGERSVVEFDNENGYYVLSGAVGGLIECVALPTFEIEMWVNEEGKLNGLPYNQTATALWEMTYGATDVIVGDVIITGGTDDEGYTLGLSNADVEFLLHQL